MKSYVFAALTLVGVAFSPSFASAADGCLGSETIREFKTLKDGTVVLNSEGDGEYKVKFSERPNNMAITDRIKTRSSGECLTEGDEVVMTGMGGHRAKYKVVSVEPAATTAQAPTE
jgi:hypothetical protein